MANAVRRINAFHQRFLWRILKIQYIDRITNEEACGHNQKTTTQASWSYSMSATTSHSPIGNALVFPGGKMWPGPTPQHCSELDRTFIIDLNLAGISWDVAEVLAEDRQQWRDLVARFAQQHRRT